MSDWHCGVPGVRRVFVLLLLQRVAHPKLHGAFSMAFISNPGAFVDVPVGVVHDALAMLGIVVPGAFIHVTIRVHALLPWGCRRW